MSWFLLLFFFVSCSLSASLSVCCLSACLCLFLVFLILSGPTTPVVSPLRSRLPTNYLAHWGSTDLLHLEDVFLVYGLDDFGFFCLILVLVLVLFFSCLSSVLLLPGCRCWCLWCSSRSLLLLGASCSCCWLSCCFSWCLWLDIGFCCCSCCLLCSPRAFSC